MKISKIKINDKEYPEKLRNIYCPPKQLYVIGNINILNDKSIGIIGSRNCSKYGEKVAKEFSYKLSKSNINIISGLARGIDSFSHIGCIMAKGKTIAVLGSGFKFIYPKENIWLCKRIVEEGGAIISEYEIDTPPNKQNFPARNRIISGLSDGILVVEAKKKSGTYITIDFALEQGKDVFIIPGSIYSQTSEGTNELIKQGASIITTPEEIIKEINTK